MDATILLYVLLGISAGVVSGTLGIGGSVIIIPVFVLLLRLTQHQAQWTALAMLVTPITLLAAWTCYQNRFVDVHLAALVVWDSSSAGFLGQTSMFRFKDICCFIGSVSIRSCPRQHYLQSDQQPCHYV